MVIVLIILNLFMIRTGFKVMDITKDESISRSKINMEEL